MVNEDETDVMSAELQELGRVSEETKGQPFGPKIEPGSAVPWRML